MSRLLRVHAERNRVVEGVAWRGDLKDAQVVDGTLLGIEVGVFPDG